jgi:predicted PurR-regulated permease PerM
MRAFAIVVIILGLAAIVFGILFIPQANSARQKVADSLTAPVTLDTLDATYDQISGKFDQLKASGMPPTDANYVMVLGQRTSLGLAKSNVGTAKMVMFNGIVDIIVGLGLVLAGLGMLRRVQSEA